MIGSLFTACWVLALIFDLAVLARIGLEITRNGSVLVAGEPMPSWIANTVFGFFTIHMLGLLACKVPS